jgi:GPI mannosyltransferase 3
MPSNDIFMKVAVRTFANSLETCLCLIGLYVYDRIGNDKGWSKTALFTLIVSLAFLIRNSSVIGWAPLIAFSTLRSVSQFMKYFKSGILIGLPILSAVIAVDSWFYGKLTFTPYNFYYMNVAEDVSSLFGTEPWHFFLTTGNRKIFKLLSLTVLPVFLFFTIQVLRRREVPEISLFIVFYGLILSIVKHKELRFVHPLIPLILAQISFCIKVMIQKWRMTKLIKFFLIYTLIGMVRSYIGGIFEN